MKNNYAVKQEIYIIDEYRNKNISSRSLLRYPGGKTRGVNFIKQFLPKNLDKLVSPFFGGGSVEFSLSHSGTKIFGYDIFPPLVEFWQCVLENSERLAKEVEKYFPLTKSKFYELQKNQSLFENKLERAAIFYVLNRSSFSGSTLSGGMSPNHPRFTLSSIERLKDFYNPNVFIEIADFEESLAKHPYTFAYLDPPYLIKNSLYGKKGDAHKGFDHQRLASLLRNRAHWLLSYNDCEEIRDLYSGFHILTPNWKYGMSSNKASKEVLIFSRNFHIKGEYFY